MPDFLRGKKLILIVAQNVQKDFLMNDFKRGRTTFKFTSNETTYQHKHFHPLQLRAKLHFFLPQYGSRVKNIGFAEMEMWLSQNSNQSGLNVILEL